MVVGAPGRGCEECHGEQGLVPLVWRWGSCSFQTERTHMPAYFMENLASSNRASLNHRKISPYGNLFCRLASPA